jgi:PTS system nitrogen regulatory IIA component
MELTARDAARLLGVSEATVYEWLRSGALPSHRVRDAYRLNRVELLEWAAARNMKVSPEIFRENGAAPREGLLAQALRRGGVIHDLPCTDKASALRAVCDRLPLPERVDREELHAVLVAREAMCSTGIGEGIAIPHPRGPLVLGLPDPQVTLAFLHEPIEYGALDRKPVAVLFVIVSTTVRVHLELLSHLMFALQDASFRRLLAARASADELLARLDGLEGAAGRTGAPRGGAAGTERG